MIHAIPTRYNGINFRSRLEAKYAALFDLCGWSWDYEPVDLGGWIPDFAIGEVKTLVEVKPFSTKAEWLDSGTIAKIIASGCDQQVLLLGTYPLAEPFGLLLEFWEPSNPPDPHGPPHPWNIWNVDFGVSSGNGKLGLCSMEGVWDNLVWDFSRVVSTHQNKLNRVGDYINGKWFDDYSKNTLQAHWREAHNLTAWKRS